MVLDSIVGRMEESTLDSISRTKSMVEENISGRMDDAFRVPG